MIKNHAFVDGNKRTGVVATDVFLGINGFILEAESEEMVRFALKVAKGYITDLHVIRSWLKRRTRKHPTGKTEETETIWRKFKDRFHPKFRIYAVPDKREPSVKRGDD